MIKQDRMQMVHDILSRGHISEYISDTNMVNLLIGDPLRIKWGTDPTSKNIHLGRSVPIMLLRDFQQLGHQIVIIIGNFTAEIGDTSDKESERPALSSESVQENMTTYIEQIGLILDIKKVEFHFNHDWWEKIDFGEFVRLTNLFSLAEFSARSNIAKRLKSGNRISVKEMLYPIMQGYDSHVIRADIEVGGTDQRFNMLTGRTIQRAMGESSQSLVMTNLINGLDGRKMSSSWGNTINLVDSPDEIFGKLMSMRDEMIITYFVHLTREPLEVINSFKEGMGKGKLNPRDIKFNLSRKIVSLIHGEQASNNAASSFTKIFQERKTPKNIPMCKVANCCVANVLVEIGFAQSKREARRAISQGGVTVDSEKISDPFFKIKNNSILKKGKRHFARIITE